LLQLFPGHYSRVPKPKSVRVSAMVTVIDVKPIVTTTENKTIQLKQLINTLILVHPVEGHETKIIQHWRKISK